MRRLPRRAPQRRVQLGVAVPVASRLHPRLSDFAGLPVVPPQPIQTPVAPTPACGDLEGSGARHSLSPRPGRVTHLIPGSGPQEVLRVQDEGSSSVPRRGGDVIDACQTGR